MILLLTDLHWGAKKASKKIYDLQMNYFREVVFPFIVKNEITEVIHCGDLFDDPESVDLRLFQDLQVDFLDWFEKNQINLYLLCGNHDMYHRNSTEYNANRAVAHGRRYIHNMHEVCSMKIDDCQVGFVPYSKSMSELSTCDDYESYSIRNQEYIICENKPNLSFIVAHHDVADVTFNIWQNSKKGLSVDELEKLKVPIVVGHFHNQSITKNVRYIGTLFQHSFGEFGFKKGFWTYCNGDFDFHEQTTLPRHYEIEYIQEGRKQPHFIVNDGIVPTVETTDYNLVREIVTKNHIKLTANNYNIETKFQEVVNDLKSIAYSEFVPISTKNVNKAIAQQMEIAEDEEDSGISADATIVDLIKNYFERLPETLSNKTDMLEIVTGKLESL